MTRRSIAAVAGAVMLTGSIVAQEPPRGSAPRPSIETVKDVMRVLTVPSSDAVFKAAAEPPVRAADWAALRQQAATLVESADLLLAPKYAVKEDAWRKLAQSHRTAAVAAQKAVEKQDPEALSTASDALYEECSNCHARYLKD